jgi:teichuronic acid biosynthesis protein TuaE
MRSKIKSKKAIRYLFLFQILASYFGAQLCTIPFGAYKLSLYRVALGLVSVLFFVNISKRNKDEHLEYRIRTSEFTFPLILFVYVLISFFWARNYSLNGWLKTVYFVYSFMLSFLVFVSIMKSYDDFKVAIIFMCIGIFFQAMIGCFEHFTGKYYFTSYAALFSTHPYYMKIRYPVAMQTNPNDFALLMFFGLHLSLCMLKLTRKSYFRVLLLMIIATEAYLIYAAGARAVMMGTFLSGLYTYMHYIRLDKHKKLIISCIMLTIIFFMVLLSNQKIFLWLKTNIGLSLSGESERIRLELIENGIKLVFHSRGFGIGAQGIIAVHNFWLEIIVIFGIPITILFLYVYINVFVRLHKSVVKSKNKQETVLSQCFSSSLVGFIIASLGPASCLNMEWLGVTGAMILSYSLLLYLNNPLSTNKRRNI